MRQLTLEHQHQEIGTNSNFHIRASYFLWRSRSGRRLRQAQKICQQLVRADRSRGQLAPQAETEIDPAPLPDARLDERSELLARIVLERIGHRHEVHVLRILLAEEIQAAL